MSKYSEKVCACCGHLFTPKSPAQKTCSKKCSLVYASSKIQPRISHKTPEGITRISKVLNEAKEAGFGASYGMYVALRGTDA